LGGRTGDVGREEEVREHSRENSEATRRSSARDKKVTSSQWWTLGCSTFSSDTEERSSREARKALRERPLREGTGELSGEGTKVFSEADRWN
jgi:hypothetical protein